MTQSNYFTVCATIALIFLPGRSQNLLGQQAELRMVIATDLMCRALPSSSADVVARFTLGDMVLPRAEAVSENGVWYLDASRVRGNSPGCWVFGPLTSKATNREAALLAATDRILGRTDQVPFEDFVAVDNLLRQTPIRAHSDTTVLSASPILQLRQLQLLQRAARAAGASGSIVRRDPLRSAWFLGYAGTLNYFEPGGAWTLAPESVWRLYERHRQSPVAEEMAWFAAQVEIASDECDAACILDGLSRMHAQYWSTFPSGIWIGEALAKGTERAALAAKIGCIYASSETIRIAADRVRSSLARVNASGRSTILAHLDSVERGCRTRRESDRPRFNGQRET